MEKTDKTRWIPLAKEEWIHVDKVCEDLSYIHEDTDADYVVGTFFVKPMLTEMGDKIGIISSPHLYYVVINSNEGMTPHFHIYNKQGKNPNRREKGGVHACVQIKDNIYFKHGQYQDELQPDIREALDKFMSTIRTEEDHSSGLGVTNFIHTINEWNEQNDLRKGMPNWVDKNKISKPDYTTIRANA